MLASARLLRIATRSSFPTVSLTRSIVSTSTSTSTPALSGTWQLDSFAPIAWTQEALLGLHTVLPWWAAIPASAIILRSTLTLPFAIWQLRTRGKMLSLTPLIRSLSVAVETNVIRRNPGAAPEVLQATAQSEYKVAVNQLYREHGLRPVVSVLLPLAVQLPVFFTAIFALRGLAGSAFGAIPFPDFETGGALWFTNLTQPDPTWLLPAINAAVFLGNVEWAAKVGSDVGIMARISRGLLRLGSFGVFFTSCFAPAGMVLYWVSSGLYSLVQSSLLNSNPIKRLLRVAEPPPLSEFAPQRKKLVIEEQQASVPSDSPSPAPTTVSPLEASLKSTVDSPSSVAWRDEKVAGNPGKADDLIKQARLSHARQTLTQEQFLAAKREKSKNKNPTYS